MIGTAYNFEMEASRSVSFTLTLLDDNGNLQDLTSSSFVGVIRPFYGAAASASCAINTMVSAPPQSGTVLCFVQPSASAPLTPGLYYHEVVQFAGLTATVVESGSVLIHPYLA